MKATTEKIEQFIENVHGFDYETETDYLNEGDSTIDIEKPFNPDKIRVDQQMLSLKYIIDLKKQNMIVSPDFQRNMIWKDRKMKSLLIESLMLRIPIPAFYFYEKDDAVFQIIDGQQRIETIYEYLNDGFPLVGLEYLEQLCGKKKFSMLPQKYQERINRTQLAINVLDSRSPKEVVYDIFRRVNTGGIPLNPQEIRNALSTSKVRKFLKSASTSKSFVIATRNKIKNDRMDAEEMVIRFIAFYKNYDFNNKKICYPYNGFSKMFDDTIEYLNNLATEDLNKYLNLFDLSMSRCYDLFGEYCFSKIKYRDNKIVKMVDKINKSLFSSFSVILLDKKFDNIDLNIYKNKALQSLANSLENNSFQLCLTVGTGDRRRIEDNFKYSNEVIEQCLK